MYKRSIIIGVLLGAVTLAACAVDDPAQATTDEALTASTAAAVREAAVEPTLDPPEAPAEGQSTAGLAACVVRWVSCAHPWYGGRPAFCANGQCPFGSARIAAESICRAVCGPSVNCGLNNLVQLPQC
jgi:hypothetical protein